MKTLLAIPTYNHNDFLTRLIKDVRLIYSGDIIVVDDGSQPKVSKPLDNANIAYIRNQRNMGKGYSLLKAANYKALSFIETNLSFDHILRM